MYDQPTIIEYDVKIPVHTVIQQPSDEGAGAILLQMFAEVIEKAQPELAKYDPVQGREPMIVLTFQAIGTKKQKKRKGDQRD